MRFEFIVGIDSIFRLNLAVLLINDGIVNKFFSTHKLTAGCFLSYRFGEALTLFLDRSRHQIIVLIRFERSDFLLQVRNLLVFEF